MRVLAAILTLLVSSAAAAQECKTCSMADACIKAYLKATSEAQSATKQAIRDWKQNLDRRASAELSSRGTLALQDAMEAQVRSELERLKECLAKISSRPAERPVTLVQRRDCMIVQFDNGTIWARDLGPPPPPPVHRRY